jgi:hypothetical protein
MPELEINYLLFTVIKNLLVPLKQNGLISRHIRHSTIYYTRAVLTFYMQNHDFLQATE